MWCLMFDIGVVVWSGDVVWWSSVGFVQCDVVLVWCGAVFSVGDIVYWCGVNAV